MMVQVLGLATTAVHVTVSGGHGEVHLFHRAPFGPGRLATAVAVREFYVVEQRLEPLERSRGGRHLGCVRCTVANTEGRLYRRGNNDDGTDITIQVLEVT